MTRGASTRGASTRWNGNSTKKQTIDNGSLNLFLANVKNLPTTESTRGASTRGAPTRGFVHKIAKMFGNRASNNVNPATKKLNSTKQQTINPTTQFIQNVKHLQKTKQVKFVNYINELIKITKNIASTQYDKNGKPLYIVLPFQARKYVRYFGGKELSEIGCGHEYESTKIVLLKYPKSAFSFPDFFCIKPDEDSYYKYLYNRQHLPDMPDMHLRLDIVNHIEFVQAGLVGVKIDNYWENYKNVVMELMRIATIRAMMYDDKGKTQGSGFCTYYAGGHMFWLSRYKVCVSCDVIHRDPSPAIALFTVTYDDKILARSSHVMIAAKHEHEHEHEHKHKQQTTTITNTNTTNKFSDLSPNFQTELVSSFNAFFKTLERTPNDDEKKMLEVTKDEKT